MNTRKTCTRLVSKSRRAKKPVEYLDADLAHGITIAKIRKIVRTINAGLSDGVGDPIPGKMCVEAAVCYGMGEDHGDKPLCVSDFIRDVKIVLNDAHGWPSKAARARGLKKVAIAQLGSKGRVDINEFSIALKTRLTQKFIAHILGCAVRRGSFMAKIPLSALAKEARTVTHKNVGEFLHKARTTINNDRNSNAVNVKGPGYTITLETATALFDLSRYVSCIEIANVIEHYVENTKDNLSEKEKHDTLLRSCEAVLLALKDARSPGCRWLYLASTTSK